MVEEFRLESGKSIWYFHPLKPLILWDSSCIIYLISAQFPPSVLSKFQSTDVDFNLETYRSGHNESDSKSFDPQGSVGSNPTVSARNYSQQLFITTAGFSFLIRCKSQTINHCISGCQFRTVVQMCIDICCSRKVTMTKPFLNLFHGYTICQKQGCTAVS